MSDLPQGNRVAVLVLNRDGAHFLDACFQSLQKITQPSFDIYLIDNASSDSSVELTRTRYPTVRIIRNETNLGFAGAYDQAIRMLDYEYVVLLNNDTVVEKKWLQALFAPVEDDEKVAACTSKIVMMSDHTVLDHAGGMLTLTGSGLDTGKWSKDQGQYQAAREVGFGCGCSLLLRKSAYLEAGGFDPRYIIYHEDVDLCWRMRMLGYSVVYVPDSVVYHHLGGGTITGMENPWKTYLCQKNRLANMIKNMGAALLIKGLFVSTAYDTVRIVRYVLLRRTDLLQALFKGYRDTLKDLKHLLKQRRVIQESRRVSDRDLSRFFQPLASSAKEYMRLVRSASN
ncbi:MAG: glycosyltransferase family 2 protein [Thermodesulfobacteriota bacterium]